jgi:hypothetical protein
MMLVVSDLGIIKVSQGISDKAIGVPFEREYRVISITVSCIPMIAIEQLISL